MIALLPGETICEADASQGSEFDCLSADQVGCSSASAAETRG